MKKSPQSEEGVHLNTRRAALGFSLLLIAALFHAGILASMASPPTHILVRITAKGDESAAVSGFIVHEAGLVFTVASIAERERALFVETAEGLLRAEVLKVSRSNGIALLRVEGLRAEPARIAREDPRPGAPVQVVGFDAAARGFATYPSTVLSVEKGGRLLYALAGRDRRASPGISGSPVFLSTGEVAGMQSEVRPSSGTLVGIAVPASILREEFEELRSKYSVVNPEIESQRRWQRYFKLDCGQTLRTEVEVPANLEPWEEIRSARARFEGVMQVAITSPPMVKRVADGLATVEFEIAGPSRTLPFLVCAAPGFAVLVVDFTVSSRRSSR
jgi:hypothetical protein